MSENITNSKLGVIGCGKMASAILEGVYNNKFINDIYIYDKNDDASSLLATKFGFGKCASIKEVMQKTNVILIATKPFVIDEILPEIKQNYNNHLVMSILAGVKLERYELKRMVRIMPNIPALLNCGMSAVCSNSSEDDIDFAYNFMKNCGEVIKTTENKMDIITALSGSGPAYYYKIIELMAQSAQKLGLDYKQALLLSAQTALGSAKMVMENDFNIEQLIKNVTTPGGCTEVGNNVLNNSSISEIIDKTIFDTAKKASDLGKK